MAKQMDLGNAALVEYQVNGEPWRCNHLDLLGAEFEGLARADLPLFHTVVSAKERSWLIVRRLFGLQPVLPPADFNPDDAREWTREELQKNLGVTRAQFQAELDTVRGAWLGASGKAEKPKANPEAEKPKVLRTEFEFADDRLLEAHGFSAMVRAMEDREWFVKRVKDYEKLLAERMTAVLARQTLMTEWQMAEMDKYLADPKANRVGSEDWRKNMKVRQELNATYEKQLAQINTLAPWASTITGKNAFTGVLSDITKGIQEYKARGDTQLIDGMFTAMEIRVECRRSVQTPEPRYRAGLVVFVNAAKQGLWDPNWQSPFAPAELKKLDKAWRAAAIAAADEAGEPLPDLEKDGPEGEYPKLAPTLNETKGE